MRLKIFSGDASGVDAEELGAARGGREDVHEDLDDGGLPCSVGSDERVDGPGGDGEVEVGERFGAGA